MALIILFLSNHNNLWFYYIPYSTVILYISAITMIHDLLYPAQYGNPLFLSDNGDPWLIRVMITFCLRKPRPF